MSDDAFGYYSQTAPEYLEPQPQYRRDTVPRHNHLPMSPQRSGDRKIYSTKSVYEGSNQIPARSPLGFPPQTYPNPAPRQPHNSQSQFVTMQQYNQLQQKVWQLEQDVQILKRLVL